MKSTATGKYRHFAPDRQRVDPHFLAGGRFRRGFQPLGTDSYSAHGLGDRRRRFPPQSHQLDGQVFRHHVLPDDPAQALAQIRVSLERRQDPPIPQTAGPSLGSPKVTRMPSKSKTVRAIAACRDESFQDVQSAFDAHVFRPLLTAASKASNRSSNSPLSRRCVSSVSTCRATTSSPFHRPMPAASAAYRPPWSMIGQAGLWPGRSSPPVPFGPDRGNLGLPSGGRRSAPRCRPPSPRSGQWRRRPEL